MLENPPPLSVADPSSNVVKRYAPPNQRNRSLGRRKSGVDGEKNQASAFRNTPSNDYRSSGSFSSESHNFGLIALEGCGNSEASQLLNARWVAAVNYSNDPSIDSSERPVMYSGNSSSVWGHIKLPHQLISPVPERDFMGELHRAMQSSLNLSF